MLAFKYQVTSPSAFRKYYHYDPKTGEFKRLQFQKLKSVYKSNKQSVVKIFDFTYPAHRAAWMYVHGEWPKNDEQIIHRNGDQRDNRIGNLYLFKKPKKDR